MSHFNGVTFAFSHNRKVWTTRYSFTPTAYAYIDNQVISCNGKHPSVNNDKSGFWLHDSNTVHNNFYGFQYNTSLAVVSNYNPSSVKIFKSLSLESNSNSWSGFVTTNSNPAGSDQSEFQRASLGTFTRKEGNSYVDIPPSEINSSAHISAGFKPVFGLGVNLEGTAESIGLSPSSPDLEWIEDIDIQHGQIPVGDQCFLVVNGDSGLSYIKGNQLVSVGDETPSYENGFAIISKVNTEDQTVSIKMKVPPADIASYPFDWSYNSGGEASSSVVYIESPSKVNGDYMRGQYMGVYLNNTSTSPIECLSINVNYEPTKLDHSLGQNA